ncbi:juvenile hormone esterase [Leptinotarsa decemlineata]|uniref:juvenile hormone esterase n=1 Tax=Leptinotarsa decemlineata TaxID=7539 RepID=UPI003D306836
MAVLIGRYSLLMTLSIAHAVITDTFSDGTLVQLKEGKIRGHILKSENGKDYYAFQEIPYAAPPVGKNRFQLPKKVEKWQGVLNTTKNTKICYQAVSRFGLEISEDCLFVNVYTPLKPGSKSKKLPVLLWIHGGGLSSESSTYEYSGPKYIMDHEIIVVTFNYRLGPFGFTTTEDDIIPANIGLKDQKFAIKWVNENIHLFGGDPAKVTLVGESSGSLSVSLHVLAQKNGGEELFRGAIMESGSPLVGFEQKNPREEAFNCGRTLDRNFRSNDTGDLLKVLQEAPAASILKECTKASGSIIEKEGDFSYAPFQTLLEGNFGKVPILLGFNSEEFIWACIDPDEDTVIALDEDPGRLVPTGINISPENKTIAGKLLKEVYTNTSFENDIGGYCRVSSRWIIVRPLVKKCELF